MSLPEGDPKQRALQREWAAARIVVIGGLIVALAVAGYFAYRQYEATHAALEAVAPPTKVDAKTLARVELEICSAELIRAKDLGIVPSYGELASAHLIRGNIPQRYVCEAQTHLTRYFIAADLRCDRLADARCVSVYRIAVQGGMLVYSRPQ